MQINYALWMALRWHKSRNIIAVVRCCSVGGGCRASMEANKSKVIRHVSIYIPIVRFRFSRCVTFSRFFSCAGSIRAATLPDNGFR